MVFIHENKLGPPDNHLKWPNLAPEITSQLYAALSACLSVCLSVFLSLLYVFMYVYICVCGWVGGYQDIGLAPKSKTEIRCFCQADSETSSSNSHRGGGDGEEHRWHVEKSETKIWDLGEQGLHEKSQPRHNVKSVHFGSNQRFGEGGVWNEERVTEISDTSWEQCLVKAYLGKLKFGGGVKGEKRTELFEVCWASCELHWANF